jgi:hypothetical protein
LRGRKLYQLLLKIKVLKSLGKEYVLHDPNHTPIELFGAGSVLTKALKVVKHLEFKFFSSLSSILKSV